MNCGLLSSGSAAMEVEWRGLKVLGREQGPGVLCTPLNSTSDSQPNVRQEKSGPFQAVVESGGGGGEISMKNVNQKDTRAKILVPRIRQQYVSPHYSCPWDFVLLYREYNVHT